MAQILMPYYIAFRVHKNLLKYNMSLLKRAIELKIKRYAPEDAFISTRLIEEDGDNIIHNKITVLIDFS